MLLEGPENQYSKYRWDPRYSDYTKTRTGKVTELIKSVMTLRMEDGSSWLYEHLIKVPEITSTGEIKNFGLVLVDVVKTTEKSAVLNGKT